MMVKPTLPLAAYIRVSQSGGKGDDLRSPELQIDAIRRAAQAKNIEIDWSFGHDIDVSGSKKKRPNLDQIVSQIKHKELGGLYVSNLSRLSRLSPKDRVDLLEDVERYGGVILSAAQDIDTSSVFGRMIREIILSIYRGEWEAYKEEWDNTQALAIRKGISIGRTPIGYLKGEDGHLVLDPATEKHIRHVFTMRAAGKSLAEITDYLVAKKVVTSEGNTYWNGTSLRRLLKSRTYLGELKHGQHVNDGTDPKNPTHKPLVDLPLWTAAQSPMGSKLTQSKEPKYLLAGLLRCQSCRYSMSGGEHRGSSDYRCNNRNLDENGNPCPNLYKRYDAKDIERAVTRELPSELSPGAFFADDQPKKIDTTELQAQYNAAKAMLDQALTPEVQTAAGTNWAKMIEDRTKTADEAMRKLADAQTLNSTASETLDGDWTTGEFREALGRVIDCISLSVDRELVIYPKGYGPKDLPGRGLKNTTLKPFEKPAPELPIRTF